MFAHKLQLTDQKTPQTWIKKVNRILEYCFRYLGVSLYTSSVKLQRWAIFSTKGELLFIKKLEGPEVCLPWDRVGRRKCHWCSTPKILLSWNIAGCCCTELKGLISFQLLPEDWTWVETHFFFPYFSQICWPSLQSMWSIRLQHWLKIKTFFTSFMKTHQDKRTHSTLQCSYWTAVHVCKLTVGHTKPTERLDDCIHGAGFAVYQPLSVWL